MTTKGQLRQGKIAAAMVLACAAAGGCNLFHRDTAQPLTSDAFISQRVQGRADRQAIDRPGQVIVEGVNPPAPDQPIPPGRGAPQSATEISPAVRQSVHAPGENDSGKPAPTTRVTRVARATPATGPAAADPSGQYVVLGTVLAQVSSRPIYAHRVLAVLDNALRAEAQRYDDPRQFRTVAADLIGKQIRAEERNELVFAVADKSLDAQEKKFAEDLTTQWQTEEANKAGGSIELAKRKWADEGWDFNERLDYQYRVSLTRLFYQRRVFPLVNVTAGDIRRYYEANKDSEFTHPGQAKFRVIKIDPKQLKLAGGAEEARRLANDVHDHALKGSFETLARDLNDPILKESGGLVPGNKDGWLPNNTYVVQKVEEAVWALKPGQITNVIEDKGVFYVAKLEDKRDAVAEDFEDLAVQQRIDDKLRGRQFKELQEQRQNQYMKDAVVQENPKMMQIALDMAMQRYASWRSVAATPAK